MDACLDVYDFPRMFSRETNLPSIYSMNYTLRDLFVIGDLDIETHVSLERLQRSRKRLSAGVLARVG